MVGNHFSHDDESLPPSHENIHNSLDLNEDNSIDANDWIALDFSTNFNKGRIPSMKSIAQKVSLQKSTTLD